MEGSLPVPGWNAHRHPQDPLRPPNYRFKDVEKCSKKLKGSVLMEIKDRDHFKEAMAEMVILCTEAIRRSSASRCPSKPLSLEYMADRLDVDDPCFGYLVRSKEGHLQGFASVTTFTNWQKNFRWDSMHELAFYYDDSDSEDEDEEPGARTRHRPRKERKVDRDGSLARALQKTIRLGDPYNEGIVWPRIAEITLLGALGCGRALVQLVIEQLEFQKGTGDANYDYLALQATDNSIPFYESLGFVRVGAVTYDEGDNGNNKRPDRSESPLSTSSEESAVVDAVPLEPSSPEKPEALALPSDIVSSALTIHKVRRAGETPCDIAKRHKVDVWDIIFLNKDVYREITPKSRLMKGTILHVPLCQETAQQGNDASPTKWFVAKENDTPRKIAKKFSIPCKQLVAANRKRLPELQPASRLKEGTRVKVSNLDHHDDICNPYCHWSFPDDSVIEGGEPSYMMVYKLDRKTARSQHAIRKSLAVPISQYSPPKLLLPRPQEIVKETVIKHPDAPKPPLEPLLATDIFKNHNKDLCPELKEKTRENETSMDEMWNELSQAKKDRYNDAAVETRKHYDQAYEQYEVEHSLWEEECAARKPITVLEKDASLFNKVIKLKEDSLEGKDYAYWFVLTYIPDLKWCHLAPMVEDGVFGPERKRSTGRIRWRLVDETEGKELDVSSTYCIPVKSKALKKTADADKEEWDILDGVGCQTSELKSRDVPVGDDFGPVSRPIRKQPIRARTAIKPMSGKIAIIKSIKPTPVQQENTRSPISSPVQLSRRPPLLQTRSLRRTPLWSPSKRRRSTPPRVSPRSTPKRKGSDESGPDRKARRINNAGARRSVLQS